LSPTDQIALFALLSVLFFMVSLFSDDERWWVSVGCTGALVLYWALNTALWFLLIVEDWSLASDLVFALGSLLLFRARRGPWLGVLFALFLLNLVLDGLRLIGSIDYASWAEAGNVTFVCQLGVASFPGLVQITRGLVGMPSRAG
jgi:hypothetical protein